MVNEFQQQWAIILGGSSGLGLASAKKLATHGMHLCIIHRNARTELESIENEFESIRKTGVTIISYNVDALSNEKRGEMIDEFITKMGKGHVKCLIHSIAKGSLKKMT
ncbi:MAG: SDR family NAD(P)-dependent oxidoreductase, partial [Flavobacterium sp.]